MESYICVTSFNQPERVNCRSPCSFLPVKKILKHFIHKKTILKEVCLHHQASESQKASVHCVNNLNFILLEYALTFLRLHDHALVSQISISGVKNGRSWTLNALPFLDPYCSIPFKLDKQWHTSIVFLCLTPVSTLAVRKFSWCSI